MTARMTRKAFLRAMAAGSLAGAIGDLSGSAAARASGSSEATDSDTASDKPTRLILLGTGAGPVLRKYRSQPSSLVVVNGTPYLIDLGYGCLAKLVQAGFAPHQIEAAFLTHHHLDHNSDIAALISFNWVEGRSRSLPIIGPFGTEKMTASALDYFSVTQRIFGQQMRSKKPASTFAAPRDISQQGLVYQDSNIRVTATVNSHYRTFDAGADKSYSYRFETADRTIVFSGDTGPSDALAEFAKDADILVAEVMDINGSTQIASRLLQATASDLQATADHMALEHLSPIELGKLAAASGVKMVALSHIGPALDDETDATRYTAGVRRHFNGPVIAGRDLLEL